MTPKTAAAESETMTDKERIEKEECERKLAEIGSQFIEGMAESHLAAVSNLAVHKLSCKQCGGLYGPHDNLCQEGQRLRAALEAAQ